MSIVLEIVACFHIYCSHKLLQKEQPDGMLLCLFDIPLLTCWLVERKMLLVEWNRVVRIFYKIALQGRVSSPTEKVHQHTREGSSERQPEQFLWRPSYMWMIILHCERERRVTSRGAFHPRRSTSQPLCYYYCARVLSHHLKTDAAVAVFLAPVGRTLRKHS